MTTMEQFRSAEAEETLRVMAHIRDLNAEVAETLIDAPMNALTDLQGAVMAERLQAMPFLLADFRFADEAFWIHCAQHEQSVSAGVADARTALARHLLSVAWHCGCAGAGPRLLLGIAHRVGELITQLRFRQIDAIATSYAQEMRLRWAEAPGFWERLVATAREGDDEEWSRVQVHTLRLLGREQL